ncbi:MAG: hypothetical protein WBO10_12355 [Pyrinomonadaceae bacterium]
MKKYCQSEPVNFSSRFNLIPVALIFLVLTLGCLGPSATDTQCEGVVKVNGKTYVGADKYEEQAGLNACNKYCIEEDDEAKAFIAIWLESDAAKDFERIYKRKPKPEDAVIEDKSILNYVTKTCAVRCKADANKGKHTLETKCK